MDVLFIEDLRIEAVIGVYEWERHLRQTLVFDIEIATDCRRAAATDEMDDALSYKAVAKRLIEFVGQSEFRLVESLAEAVAGLLREEFGVSWLRLRVNKEGAVRGARGVGVVIERGTSG